MRKRTALPIPIILIVCCAGTGCGLAPEILLTSAVSEGGALPDVNAAEEANAQGVSSVSRTDNGVHGFSGGQALYLEDASLPGAATPITPVITAAPVGADDASSADRIPPLDLRIESLEAENELLPDVLASYADLLIIEILDTPIRGSEFTHLELLCLDVGLPESVCRGRYGP